MLDRPSGRDPPEAPLQNRTSGKALPLESALKRAIDVAASLILLIFLAPLLAATALAIVAASPGPVLFQHERIGLNGRAFGCLKFRTMVPDAHARLAAHLRQNETAAREWAETQKLKDDPRVTSIGRILRSWSIDELPQLINVLKGDMSLVGPRPITAKELERYGAHQQAYLSVKPGLTGLWQVSGRSTTTYEERVAMDAEYARHWSLRLDFIILLKTIPAVFRTWEAG